LSRQLGADAPAFCLKLSLGHAGLREYAVQFGESVERGLA
jgi:hypothetical protein